MKKILLSLFLVSFCFAESSRYIYPEENIKNFKTSNVLDADVTKWNTAYSWGDHSLVGYLTSYNETDPCFVASSAHEINDVNITSWNTAYTHSQDNTQAHSDYLLNNGNDTTSGTLGMATGSTIGNLTFANGSITDSSGAISFGNENLATTGTLGAGAITGTSFTIGANTLTTSEWAYLDGQDQTVKTTSTPQFLRLGIGTAASETHGLNLLKTLDASANGINNIIYCTPTSDSQSYLALNFAAEARASTYNITTLVGVNGFAGCGSLYRGTITSAIGLQSKVSIAGALSGTDPICTSAYLFKGDSLSATLGATIGTAYGLYLPSITAGGTNYAIYSAGGASYHAGALEIGGQTTCTGGISSGNIEPITDNTYYIGKNDDDSPLAYKGVILKDTTDGKYYRIEVISGVITATDLTD